MAAHAARPALQTDRAPALCGLLSTLRKGAAGFAARRRVLAVAVLVIPGAAMAVSSAKEQAVPRDPGDLFLGRWKGEARNGSERREVGLAFDLGRDGTVGARMWLPEINAYGAPLGTLQVAGSEAAVPDWGIQLSLRDGELTGTLAQPELSISARRVGSLPDEPPIPKIAPGPPPEWTLRTGPLCGSPTVVAGAIIVADTAGVIRSVEPRDGSVRWARELGSPVYGQVAAAGGRLYAAADSGELFCLDASTGGELWRSRYGPAETKHAIPAHFGDMEWDFTGPDPVIAEGVIYVAGADHALRAMDAASGSERWHAQAGERIRGGACVAGARVVFGSRDHFVYSVDRRDGRLCWTFDTGSPVNTAPVFAGDRIVIGTRDRSRLFALDAETGKLAWTVYYWLSWVESAPALAGGTLYIGSSDEQRIRAIDADSGRVIWDTRVWGWTWGTPLVVGDTVYYGSAGAQDYLVHQRPSVGAIDRRTGRIMWRHPLPMTPGAYVCGVARSLAVCGDRIIAAGVDGWLSAFPVR